MMAEQGARRWGLGLAVLGPCVLLLGAGPGAGPNDSAATTDDDLAVARVANLASASAASGEARGAVEPASPAAALIARAKHMVAQSHERFEQVRDYTCTFQKRELVNGKLTGQHVMSMKVRNKPFSVYFKFQQPHAGREAIYVAGRNNGKVLVHDVGVAKVLTGTMKLDPKGGMAMDENRHPVTDAGIGHLIQTLVERWEEELQPGESLVSIDDQVQWQGRACSVITSTHPVRSADFLYHLVKVYIDREHGVPVRFEAYDWPKKAGGKPELLEEYNYSNLKLNVGLSDEDFDANNKAYSYGRF